MLILTLLYIQLQYLYIATILHYTLLLLHYSLWKARMVSLHSSESTSTQVSKMSKV